jgi:hypothetical protein
VWKHFENFYTFIDSTEPLQTYVIATYLDLAHFLISWVVFKKKGGWRQEKGRLEAYHLLGQHVNRQLLGGWDQEE